MKKFFRMIFVAALVLSLGACGNSQASETLSENPTQIPNPWTDYAEPEEAWAAAGFELTTPDEIKNYPQKVFRALLSEEGNLLEVIYENAQAEEVRIRKAPGSDDISGDYNTYAEQETLTLDGKEVLLKGNDGKVYLATWTDADYTYAVSVSAGASSADFSALIAAIH